MKYLAKLLSWKFDLLGIAGAMAVVYGVTQVSSAAGWIVGGGFAVMFAWIGARSTVETL